MSKTYNYTCDICGRPLFRKIVSHGIIYCDKHYKQMKKYGHVLDHSPRTTFDPNEYHIKGDITIIDLYDRHCNKVAEAIIDTEDLNKVKHIKWRLSSSGYAMNSPKYKNSTIDMSRIILDTDQFVDHINHNTLDNRKSNLRIVTKSQNAMNSNFKGVSFQKNKYYAHIKIDQKMINLGTYVYQEEAYYARWYAEVLLFKDCPKQEPELPEGRSVKDQKT